MQRTGWHKGSRFYRLAPWCIGLTGGAVLVSLPLSLRLGTAEPFRYAVEALGITTAALLAGGGAKDAATYWGGNGRHRPTPDIEP